jgi:transmembrane sensor
MDRRAGNDMSHDIDDRLLDRYLAGEATADERAAVDSWIAADPGRSAILQQARLSLGGAPHDFDTVGAWARLRGRVQPGPDTVPAAPRAPRRSGRRRVGFATQPRFAGWKIAALLAGMLLAGAAAWRLVSSRATAGPTASQTFVTMAGQRDTVHLSDGSTIILAPVTTLEVSTAYGSASRDVRLTGEAFFNVAHDSRRPFRIDAAGSRVVVLGTRFGVRSRAAGVTVAVEEGSVSFAPPSIGGAASMLAVTLGANQVGWLPAGAARPVVEADATARLAWLEGVLEFEDAPLADVAADIERWFGIRVRFEDQALAERRVTGRFNAESVDQVLDALSLALGLSAERTDSTVVIRPGTGR